MTPSPLIMLYFATTQLHHSLHLENGAPGTKKGGAHWLGYQWWIDRLHLRLLVGHVLRLNRSIWSVTWRDFIVLVFTVFSRNQPFGSRSGTKAIGLGVTPSSIKDWCAWCLFVAAFMFLVVSMSCHQKGLGSFPLHSRGGLFDLGTMAPSLTPTSVQSVGLATPLGVMATVLATQLW